MQFNKALVFIEADGDEIAAVTSNLRILLESEEDQTRNLRLWSALSRSMLGGGAQGAAGDGMKPVSLIVEAIAPHGAFLTADTFAFLKEANGATPFNVQLLAGTEHVIMPGEGECALFCPLVRLPHLSATQFSAYWLNVHAEFGRRDPESRYRQLHASEQNTFALATATGFAMAPFDGVAIAYFTDPGELNSKLSSPEIAIEAYEDERRFIDHEHSAFLPFERLF